METKLPYDKAKWSNELIRLKKMHYSFLDFLIFSIMALWKFNINLFIAVIIKV